MRATIYTRTPSGASAGTFATVARADLPCLLESVSANAATTVPDRGALAALRIFRFDASYDLPSVPYQIAVDAFPGKRWTPQGNTDDVDFAPGIGVIGKTVQVVRA